MYDFLGDVGGFQGAFTSIFSVIAGFFSGRFFESGIASFYVRKKAKSEINETEDSNQTVSFILEKLNR